MSSSSLRTRALGVVVPVHNEEELLGDALNALGAAFSHLGSADIPSVLVLVFDSCRDESVPVAEGWTARLSGGTSLCVVGVVSDERNVGVARYRGCAAVLDYFHDLDPEHVWIATTDADSRVPRNWLSEQVRQHDRGIDVWAGRVAVKGEGARLETLWRWKREYDREAQPIHGASLGFNAAKYLAAGGFSSLATGEDRALLGALADCGATTHFDSLLRVLTSARQGGRAPHGFAEAFHRFDAALGVSGD
jgi:glycosyltransferase involved in cell wall biosynthesis